MWPDILQCNCCENLILGARMFFCRVVLDVGISRIYVHSMRIVCSELGTDERYNSSVYFLLCWSPMYWRIDIDLCGIVIPVV